MATPKEKTKKRKALKYVSAYLPPEIVNALDGFAEDRFRNNRTMALEFLLAERLSVQDDCHR